MPARVPRVLVLSAFTLTVICAPQFLRHPVHPGSPSRKADGPSAGTAHIVSVTYLGTNARSPGRVRMQRLRAAIRRTVLNSGRFERVVLRQEPRPQRDPAVISFSVRVHASDDPGRKAMIRGRIEFTGYRGAVRVFHRSGSCEKSYMPDLFGRTDAIEADMRSCYERILNEMADSLQQADFEPIDLR